MNIIKHKNEIEVTGVSDFDLEKIFECGQCFRWNVDETGAYVGVAFGRVARMRCAGESVFISGSVDDFEAIWCSYLDLDRDYSEIRKNLCVDDFMQNATDFGAGIRILRQEKWEALCSFIISQNNNIPRIKSIVEALCREFGDIVEFEGKQYYTFPSAEKLANVSVESLAPLRCGYRAAYIISAAKDIASGTIDLDALANSTPHVARTMLKSIHGIGDKVA
ncbi:MAG: hypothetical protein FWD05_12860, partial [Oscillospiraceae bacterium]|nr:hypothetical protein [Oscillospiraceae bacterium]